jgi:hypothetical protein
MLTSVYDSVRDYRVSRRVNCRYESYPVVRMGYPAYACRTMALRRIKAIDDRQTKVRFLMLSNECYANGAEQGHSGSIF